MADREVQITGIVYWAKLKPGQVNKYGKLSVDFYPQDKETRATIKSLNLRNGIKEDKEGNLFYTFTKKLDDKFHPGEVPAYKDGDKFEGAIGNGSEVTV